MKNMNINIDGKNADTAQNRLYRGIGMVSGNNSSRLLLDYKAENYGAYTKILEYMFGEKGLAISHLKIEMGSDINSSSGTEPCVKRSEDETADVTRGAGYILASDAKKINPDLTLDMLWWSEPLWITNAKDIFAARYKWYKETLDAAYNTFGLKFDYVSATQNERGWDCEWIKYLSKKLKEETDCPYDYSKIRIVTGEEVCTWYTADDILRDKELLEAIDVVGSHYTSFSTENARKLSLEHGKELWFSEASAPMVYARGASRFSEKSLCGINGVLDIANRFITMYPQGLMTLCEFQPVVSAYYDGVTYCHKQFIDASEPWNGKIFLDSGFFAMLHFSQFFKKGWAFVKGACAGDGKAGGNGHALVDAVFSYMTAADMKSGDYSTVITNTTDEDIFYTFNVSNLKKAHCRVYLWETAAACGSCYDENYFVNTQALDPVENEDKSYSYQVKVRPGTILTVSTIALDFDASFYKDGVYREGEVLKLPYYDDFCYEEYGEGYLAARGYAPRYMTDQGGAFEVVVRKNAPNCLMQKITIENKALEWGATPEPTTNFGDDRWSDYSVCADVMLTKTNESDNNYAGLGLRYNLAAAGKSGYIFKLFENRRFTLSLGERELCSGVAENADVSGSVSLKLAAVGNCVTAYINGKQAAYFKADKSAIVSAGRAALYSSYNLNCFANLKIEACDNTDYFVTRLDDTDGRIEYSGKWEHDFNTSFCRYKRTLSTGTKGGSFEFLFEGTGFAVSGFGDEESAVTVYIDDKEHNTFDSLVCSERQSPVYVFGLENKLHKVRVEVVAGSFSIDSIEINGR